MGPDAVRAAPPHAHRRFVGRGLLLRGLGVLRQPRGGSDSPGCSAYSRGRLTTIASWVQIEDTLTTCRPRPPAGALLRDDMGDSAARHPQADEWSTRAEPHPVECQRGRRGQGSSWEPAPGAYEVRHEASICDDTWDTEEERPPHGAACSAADVTGRLQQPDRCQEQQPL
ncbi:hypothetical protein GCM10010317_008210 [Streptomyces mirabilis]|nr:hypothetical protein GCM10010317_008210 [Streptomyces mirabilis]